MPSSGPDDGHAWLQVGAAALKQSVALGCIPEATLLFRAAQTRDPLVKPSLSPGCSRVKSLVNLLVR
jgi:hypothetical protein